MLHSDITLQIVASFCSWKPTNNFHRTYKLIDGSTSWNHISSMSPLPLASLNWQRYNRVAWNDTIEHHDRTTSTLDCLFRSFLRPSHAMSSSKTSAQRTPRSKKGIIIAVMRRRLSAESVKRVVVTKALGQEICTMRCGSVMLITAVSSTWDTKVLSIFSASDVWNTFDIIPNKISHHWNQHPTFTHLRLAGNACRQELPQSRLLWSIMLMGIILGNSTAATNSTELTPP